MEAPDTLSAHVRPTPHPDDLSWMTGLSWTASDPAPWQLIPADWHRTVTIRHRGNAGRASAALPKPMATYQHQRVGKRVFMPTAWWP